MARIAIIALTLICIRSVMNPITHRLSPDIGTAEGEHDREGQVVGFHYEKRTWWGFRKQVFDRIKFVKGRGPQYLDGGNWKDVPDEGWGVYPEDDRVMEVDNRGWHEE